MIRIPLIITATLIVSCVLIIILQILFNNIPVTTSTTLTAVIIAIINYLSEENLLTNIGIVILITTSIVVGLIFDLIIDRTD